MKLGCRISSNGLLSVGICRFHSFSNCLSAVLDDELLTAQVFIFFVAGFETSSSTMSFCLYELAVNEDVQEAARSEVDSILAELDGDGQPQPLTYEHVARMTYLEKVLLGKLASLARRG